MYPRPEHIGPDIRTAAAEIAGMLASRTGIRLFEHQYPRFLNGVESVGISPDELGARPLASPEWGLLLESATVGESLFFRDGAQMALLEQRILPERIADRRRRKDLSLRVWSAGCASGQELYSIAILLRELLPDFDDWCLDLVGTDISPGRIAEASRGMYRPWSLRRVSAERQSRCFQHDGVYFRLLPAYRAGCRFFRENLVEAPYRALTRDGGDFDLVLCRNVLLYFAPERVRQVADSLAARLDVGGVLMLGVGDPDPGDLTGLERLWDCEAGMYYRRRSAPSFVFSAAAGL